MIPVRVVLDSNVFISAFLFGGPPRSLLHHVLRGAAECFISAALLDEIGGVLRRPKFGLTAEQALAVTGEIRDLCRMVSPVETVRMVEEDPDDNAVLECAAAASADLIVSGDRHLLRLGSWRGIRIRAPAEASAELGPRPGD